MGFCTTPITIEQAKELVGGSDGEVVSASKEVYFEGWRFPLYLWFYNVIKAELKDDGITLFLTLPDNDFVEYCTVKDIY